MLPPESRRAFSSLALLAEGPVLVDNVEVLVAQAPQATAGSRVAAGFSLPTLPAEAFAPAAAWRQASRRSSSSPKALCSSKTPKF